VLGLRPAQRWAMESTSLTRRMSVFFPIPPLAFETNRFDFAVPKMYDKIQVWTLRRPIHNPNIFLLIRNMARYVFRFIVLLIYIYPRDMFRFVKGILICCTMFLYMLPSTRCNEPTPSRKKHP
jgi:hypothetical protein